LKYKIKNQATTIFIHLVAISVALKTISELYLEVEKIEKIYKINRFRRVIMGPLSSSMKTKESENMSSGKRTTINERTTSYCHWCGGEVYTCNECGDYFTEENQEIICVSEGERHLHIGCDET